MIAKPVASEVIFFEVCALDHRAHRAVEEDDSLLDQLLQPLCRCVVAHALQTSLKGTAVMTLKSGMRP
jgi:hypothetical protein